MTHRVGEPAPLAVAVLETLVTSHDRQHIEDPCVVRRTVFVDTGGP